VTAAGSNERAGHGAVHFELYARPPGGVHWRLLSANNRDAGHSGSGFPDVAACLADLETMLAHLADLKPVYSFSGQRWSWALGLGEQVVAKSSRSFDRRVRCVAACERFIRTAPLALVSPVLGRRRPARLDLWAPVAGVAGGVTLTPPPAGTAAGQGLITRGGI
jgi:hypothetical protein